MKEITNLFFIIVLGIAVIMLSISFKERITKLESTIQDMRKTTHEYKVRFYEGTNGEIIVHQVRLQSYPVDDSK